MKPFTLLVALLVPILIAAAVFVPEAAVFKGQMILAALACGALAFVLIALLPGQKAPAAAPRVEAPQPVAPPVPANQAEAEIVTLLGILQEKGRFIDFVMDDITAYNDTQVGAAARVVHAGCRAAVKEHFDIQHVRSEAEGQKVTVEPGYAADEYRLVGKISGEPPFQGQLVHRGWRAESVTLPRVLTVRGDRLPTIAPAEVELG